MKKRLRKKIATRSNIVYRAYQPSIQIDNELLLNVLNFKNPSMEYFKASIMNSMLTLISNLKMKSISVSQLQMAISLLPSFNLYRQRFIHIALVDVSVKPISEPTPSANSTPPTAIFERDLQKGEWILVAVE